MLRGMEVFWWAVIIVLGLIPMAFWTLYALLRIIRWLWGAVTT